MKLADRLLCSGCAACSDACGCGAIALVADREGFLYPKIDASKCVDCGRCAAICPVLRPENPCQPLKVFAAKAKEDELRLVSSSGGVFTLLARRILSQGGRVYGAAFDPTDWSVRHIGVADEQGLGELRGSKYLQSRTEGIYRQVERDLRAGRSVLFSGTPCQISALRSYLGRDWESLALVEVVCHGVPSSRVWKNYLEYRVAALDGGRDSAPAEGRNIKRIAFRRKDCGWKRSSLSLRFANDKENRSVFSDDPFMRAFLAELCNRPSCHHCQFRELRSGADLTIGDFWGVSKFHPEMDDDRGTSLVLVNTDKGAFHFSCIRKELDCKGATFDEAAKGNPALVTSPSPHRNRNRFLLRCSSRDFDRMVERMLRPSLVQRVRRLAGRVLRTFWRGKSGK